MINQNVKFSNKKEYIEKKITFGKNNLSFCMHNIVKDNLSIKIITSCSVKEKKFTGECNLFIINNEKLKKLNTIFKYLKKENKIEKNKIKKIYLKNIILNKSFKEIEKDFPNIISLTSENCIYLKKDLNKLYKLKYLNLKNDYIYRKEMLDDLYLYKFNMDNTKVINNENKKIIQIFAKEVKFKNISKKELQKNLKIYNYPITNKVKFENIVFNNLEFNKINNKFILSDKIIANIKISNYKKIKEFNIEKFYSNEEYFLKDVELNENNSKIILELDKNRNLIDTLDKNVNKLKTSFYNENFYKHQNLFYFLKIEEYNIEKLLMKNKQKEVLKRILNVIKTLDKNNDSNQISYYINKKFFVILKKIREANTKIAIKELRNIRICFFKEYEELSIQNKKMYFNKDHYIKLGVHGIENNILEKLKIYSIIKKSNELDIITYYKIIKPEYIYKLSK